MSTTDTKKVSLPRDVKDAVSKCRASVQEALGKRISRMDIEFPVGTDFGIEKKAKKKKTSTGSEVDQTLLQRSDRELCRIFVEMFQPLGGDSIAAIFVDELLADQAKAAWKGDSSCKCQILTTGRRRSSKKSIGAKKKKKAMGFAAKLNAELDLNDDPSSTKTSGPFQLPKNCELALFVNPGPKELLVVERICNEVGMGTLVVLLNARLDNVDKFASAEAQILFMDEFEPVFHLKAAPQDVAPNCLIHRAYPSDWILARKPNVGSPKVIAVQETKFSIKECQEAYDSIEIGELEGAVEGFMENVVTWFK